MNLLRLSLAILPALLMGVVACDDGDSESTTLTLEEYYTEVEAIFDEAHEATAQLNEDLQSDLAAASTFEERVNALQSFVTDASSLFEDTIDDMNDLSPPPEVEQPHSDFVESATAVEAALNSLGEGLDEAEDEAEAADRLEEFEADTAGELFAIDEACADLQDAAEDNSIMVDLRCTERIFPERPQEPF